MTLILIVIVIALIFLASSLTRKSNLEVSKKRLLQFFYTGMILSSGIALGINLF